MTDKKDKGRKVYDCVQLCRDYYLTSYEIRECSRKIRAEECPEVSVPAYDDNGRCIYGGSISCLMAYFQACAIGEGKNDCRIAVEKCPVCSVKLEQIVRRKELRYRLGGIKQKIQNAGRWHHGNSLAEQFQEPTP